MSDEFESYAKGIESPASKHFSITPSDDGDLATIPRALYICGQGDITIRDIDGVDITYIGVSGLLQFRGVRILSTGTTATNIIGWC